MPSDINLINHPCVYRGKARDNDEFQCQIHAVCKLTNGGRYAASCDDCRDRLALDDLKFGSLWIDPLRVVDRFQRNTDALRGLLAGRPAFLFCGGPSSKKLPLELLSRRGCWTMAVNNAAGCHRFRPQAFLCGDPPSKFSHSIWRDPGIAKFIPTVKFSHNRDRSGLREKLPTGEFAKLEQTVCDMPNVWGFERRDWLLPDESFFLEPTASPGNFDAGMERTGQPKTICNMLLAMRLMRYLGARIVFLVGVDFWMDPNLEIGQNYAFGEARTPDDCASNNRQFVIVNKWLCEMGSRGVFDRFNIKFYNCNPESRLSAFQFVPFDKAVDLAVVGIEEKPDCVGWYKK